MGSRKVSQLSYITVTYFSQALNSTFLIILVSSLPVLTVAPNRYSSVRTTGLLPCVHKSGGAVVVPSLIKSVFVTFLRRRDEVVLRISEPLGNVRMGQNVSTVMANDLFVILDPHSQR